MIIQVILIVMALLTFFSGIATFFGSQSKRRMATFWYLLATCSVAVWSVAIAIFINLPEDATNVAPTITAIIYCAAITLILGLAGYNSWNYKIGRIVTVIGSVVGTFLIACIIFRPELLYSSITLSNDTFANTVHLHAASPFYISYAAFMVIITAFGVSCNISAIIADKKKGHRVTADLVFFASFSVTMFGTFFFDLIMPIWDYGFIWIGPICTAIANLGFFYRLIKQRLTAINTTWMIFLSYAIIAAIAAIVYLTLFYFIFTALFHGQEPSPQVVILNFIMFLIVILSMPIFHEAWTNIISLVDINKIDLSFITKKLAKIATEHDNYHDLADLLADHLHFEYIGFLINGKIYDPSSASISLDKAEIAAIAKTPLSPTTVWQRPDEDTQLILNQHNIVSLASLGAGHQILIGKPLVKRSFSKREMAEIETILNLVAAIL